MLIVGDVVNVAIDSWAGRTLHAARVEKVCAKRVRVFWLDSGPRHGQVSYVPREAIRPYGGSQEESA